MEGSGERETRGEREWKGAVWQVSGPSRHRSPQTEHARQRRRRRRRREAGDGGTRGGSQQLFEIYRYTIRNILFL